MGTPTIPDCATTPNAAFAVPCTFDITPTAPGKYLVVTRPCHPGSAGRDSLSAPKFVNTDFSIVKNTKLTERLNLQIRTEVFDLFNHPNFGDPTNTATSAAFGKILQHAFPGRRLRLCAPNSVRAQAALLTGCSRSTRRGQPPVPSLFLLQIYQEKRIPLHREFCIDPLPQTNDQLL